MMERGSSAFLRASLGREEREWKLESEFFIEAEHKRRRPPTGPINTVIVTFGETRDYVTVEFPRGYVRSLIRALEDVDFG
jgi:hypothetical protein